MFGTCITHTHIRSLICTLGHVPSLEYHLPLDKLTLLVMGYLQKRANEPHLFKKKREKEQKNIKRKKKNNLVGLIGIPSIVRGKFKA